MDSVPRGLASVVDVTCGTGILCDTLQGWVLCGRGAAATLALAPRPPARCLAGGAPGPGAVTPQGTPRTALPQGCALCFSEAGACGPGCQSASILVLMVTLPWGHCPPLGTPPPKTATQGGGVCSPSSLKHCSQQPDIGTTQSHHLRKKMKSCR